MHTTSAKQSQITVNGQARPAADLVFISDLVAELQLDMRKVAIEQNRTIIPRSAYATTPIHDGDAIEIVSFIGGG